MVVGVGEGYTALNIDYHFSIFLKTLNAATIQSSLLHAASAHVQ